MEKSRNIKSNSTLSQLVIVQLALTESRDRHQTLH